MGELLTRWTVRAALALYALALVWRLEGKSSRAARWMWTIGCVAFVVHVLCAFGFFHHRSHMEAYAETARRTKELVGWDWGGGVYFNYAFALVWILDSIWWWSGIEKYERRSRIVEWLIQGFMAFMWINATIVFGSGVIRWVGAAVTFALMFLYYRLWRSRERSEELK